ncbi:MAG: hypothetical protein K0R25_967 [Rickettsiaceae bacterium]|jgi:YesN/AraC family two-component response regulator|nr:hypothetical protein [Rickettsiaceae bacterium]
MTKNKKSQFNILFVDDEENARKYFEKSLKESFNILTASNIEEARNIVNEQSKNIGIVITDQRMPGGNGVKLLKFLKENHPNIIRLLTTAYSDLSDAIEAVNSGEILRYIQKPWDYNLLKIELEQALELFELHSERRQMLTEKLIIKKKFIKIERVKILLLFARVFKFLNFSDAIIKNFITAFANRSTVSEDESWKEFEFGNQEILEVKFLTDLMDRLQDAIPYSGNYGFNQNLNSDNLKSMLEEEARKMNLSLTVRIAGQAQTKVNSESLNILVKKLAEIAALSKAPTSFVIDKIEGGLSINFEAKELEGDNIFTANPNKTASVLYVNLLICYLITGHHGGIIEISGSEKQNLNCTIKLPADCEKNSFIPTSQESIENSILGAMIS